MEKGDPKRIGTLGFPHMMRSVKVKRGRQKGDGKKNV